MRRRALVVAHRGGGAEAPENTLAAFRAAIAAGADAIEVDVLPSRDGHPVVHHDERLLRTAGVDAAVWDLDLRELRRLDVGAWFGPRWARERIVTLEEVVAMLPPNVRLVADFKHGAERFPGLDRRVAEIVRPLGTRFAALSIQHGFALELAGRVPGGVPLLTLRQPPLTDDDARRLRELPPTAGLATSMRALSAALLAIAAERSRPVYLFTPNQPLELKVALTIGVEAIITDRVSEALELRQRLEQEPDIVP
ncbi:MAG TPA: glycerophosphodiester phosphodiesterase family protein [Gaiellales bacterium]|nr:glycerophosphodiester phosphodiesterase family protein [Gaiellales bacterium]